MSGDAHQPPRPAPTAAPGGTSPEGGNSGVGAQTALLALIRKRRQSVDHEPDAHPPEEEPREPGA